VRAKRERGPYNLLEDIPAVSIAGDRVVFEDMEMFGEFMDILVKADEGVRNEFEEREQFKSLRTTTYQLLEELDQIEEEPAVVEPLEVVQDLEIVEDPFFATILNAEGEIQIGSMVYKVTGNYVYKVSEERDHLLEGVPLWDTEYSVVKKKLEIPDVSVREVKRAITSIDVAGKTAVSDDCTKSLTPPGSSQGRDRRLRGESWITDYTFYVSAGSKTQGQRKKRCGGCKWKTITDLRNITVMGNYTVAIQHGASYGQFNVVLPFDRIAVYSITQSSGPSSFINGAVSSSHSGEYLHTGENPVTGQCNTTAIRQN